MKKLFIFCGALTVLAQITIHGACPPILKRYYTQPVGMGLEAPARLTRRIVDGRGNVVFPERLEVPVLIRIGNSLPDLVSGYQVKVDYFDPFTRTRQLAGFARAIPFVTDPSMNGPDFDGPGERTVRARLVLPREFLWQVTSFRVILTGAPGYFPPSACPTGPHIEVPNSISVTLDLRPGR